VQEETAENSVIPDMLKCKCGRLSPADRASCIYCGCEIAGPEGLKKNVKVNFQELEAWEIGFIVVVKSCAIDADIEAAARIVPLSSKDIENVCSCVIPLPIARLRTASEAEVIANRLIDVGVDGIAINEATLSPGIEPKRLRSIFDGPDRPAFVDFNTGENVKFSWDDVTNIISGTILTSRLDSLEKRGRGGKQKTLEGTVTTEDTPVIDVYLEQDPQGFRLYTAGTDFSFLGDEMSLLAADNIRKTLAFLSKHAAAARTITNYGEIREILGHTWPIAQSADAKGSIGGVVTGRKFSKTVTTSNAEQFIRFSRLQSLFS
jgi:hypothetical protein